MEKKVLFQNPKPEGIQYSIVNTDATPTRRKLAIKLINRQLMFF